MEHLPEIYSSHEETDVTIIIYIKYIHTTMSHIKTTRVSTKDSDMFLLLCFAKSFTVDNLVDRGERFINNSQLADNYYQEHIASVLALRVFTGAYCISALKGKGKVRPMKLLSRNSNFVHILAAVGFTWTLDDDHIVNGIEEFTCRLYGVGPRVKQVDVATEIKVKNRCGSNVPFLSPRFRHVDGFSPSTPRESISKYVSGAGLSKNFQKYRPLLPLVIMSQKREKLEPHWFERDIIPMVLVDILEDNGNDEEITDEIHIVDEYDEDENVR